MKMSRRTLGKALAVEVAACLSAQPEQANPFALPPGYATTEMGGLKHFMPPKQEQICTVIYLGMTALDLIGPQQIFGFLTGAKVNFACLNDLADETVIDFLVHTGKRARYVTSECSGSLVLGAAGLLRGYRATSHWAALDVSPSLGATLAANRAVEDRNRITAGGVTASIDFGLFLAAKLRAKDDGEALRLMPEYDPQLPFHAGTRAEAARSHWSRS
jgi:hypothetical protein